MHVHTRIPNPCFGSPPSTKILFPPHCWIIHIYRVTPWKHLLFLLCFADESIQYLVSHILGSSSGGGVPRNPYPTALSNSLILVDDDDDVTKKKTACCMRWRHAYVILLATAINLAFTHSDCINVRKNNLVCKRWLRHRFRIKTVTPLNASWWHAVKVSNSEL